MALKTGSTAKSSKPAKKRSASLIVLWIIVILLAGGLGYMAWLNLTLRKPEVQTRLADEANQAIVENVGKLILIPTNETPTIATIVNVENLRKTNVDFYRDAQNGDRLLIYSTKAIIYREEENKIINVAPVVIKPQEGDGLENSVDTFDNSVSNRTENTNEPTE